MPPRACGVNTAEGRALGAQVWPLLTVDLVGPKRKCYSNSTARWASHTHSHTHTRDSFAHSHLTQLTLQQTEARGHLGEENVQ